MVAYSVKLFTKLRWHLLGLMLLILISVIGTTAWMVTQDRSREILDASQTMQSLAMVLSKEADATLTLADTVLTNLINGLDLHSRDVFADEYKLHQALDQQRLSLEGGGEETSFSHLFVIGPGGDNVANSFLYPTKRVNVADREYFMFHRDHKDLGLHVSQPLYSKVTQERMIFLTKRLEDSSGAFLGLIGIHLKLRHFDRIFGSLSLPPGGTVTVIRSDGWGVYRYPIVESFFRKSIESHEGFQHMLRARAGHLEIVKSPYDKALRVAGFYASDKYPLLSIVTVLHDSVLVNWLRNTIRTGLVAVAGALLIIGLMFFSFRQLDHVQNALELSSSDSLTGLRNRRAFDGRMDEEWRRAVRGEYPLSLLFVDVDFFKLYNDAYGHRAGDKCLVAIAAVMEKEFARGGEMVARYGGEEFVILLPNTELDAAKKSAAHLLEAVHALHIEHKTSIVSSSVTVSIGVATLLPTQLTSKEDLIDQADSALYAAKHAGRNQCSVYKSET